MCHSGAEALAVARQVDPDAVVLDLGLPGIDGLEVCRQMRTFSDAYVMLTARDTELDTIVGLSVGADDYITKPFSPRELVARIRAMLRRPRTPPRRALRPTPKHRCRRSPFRAAVDRHRRPPGVSRQRSDPPLTRTEFDILAALCSRPGVVWTRRPTDRRGVGRTVGWVTTIWSTSMLDTCAESWPTTRHSRGTSSPSAGWATGWEAEVTSQAGVGLRRRLLLAQALVLLVVGVTTAVVAAVVGPPLFRIT